MKKLLKLFVAALLLIASVTSIPQSHFSSIAAEEENISFSLQSPREGDLSLSGQAMPDQDLTAQVDGQTYETQADSAGDFEIELDAPLEEGQTIQVAQGLNTIETTVQPPDAEETTIEQEGPFNPEGLVDQDQENENLEEMNEENEVAEEETNTQMTEEGSNSENTEGDPLADEDPTGPEEDSSDENLEDTESFDSEDTEDPEETESQDSNETDQASQEDEEDLTQDERDNLEFPALRMAEPLPEEEDLPAEQAPGATTSGPTAYVSTYDQLVDAMEDSAIERVVLEQDIHTDSSTRRITVESDSRAKVLDGNNYSLTIDDRAVFDARRNLDHLTVRNFTNLYSQHSGSVDGMFRMRTNPYQFHVENITYNRDNLSDTAHLSSSWESDINFYGNVTINMGDQRDYVANYRRAVIRDGANVTINAVNHVFSQRNTSGTNGRPSGLVVGDNARLIINAGSNIVENGFRRSRDVVRHLDVGVNSFVDLTSRNGTVFLAEGDGAFTSTIQGDLNVSGNTGIEFPGIEMTISKGGLASFDTLNTAFLQNRSSQAAFTVEEGGEWSIHNSHPSNPAINFRESARFNITAPQNVTWISDANQIMSTDNTHRFSITDLSMRAQQSPNSPVEESSPIESLIFDLGANGFQVVGEATDPEWFNTVNPNNLYRWEFRANLLELLAVPNLDFGQVAINNEPNKIISRNTPDQAEINVLDTRGNSNWELHAQASPLTNESNHVLEEALYFVDGNQVSLIEQEAVIVAQSDQATRVDGQPFVDQVAWEQDEGILVITNPIQARVDSRYSSTITWTLSDAP